MVNWKKNLVMVWLSQFLSIMGFAFAMPFAPYYIQSLGVQDPVDVKLWVSLFAAATPTALAIFSPIWGTLADLYGRRIMLLRANFSASIILVLMALVRNVETLVLLRFIQGTLTGTVPAAQTLVSAHTPQNRSGMALGSLSAALFTGAMAGAGLGGFVADLFGYRLAFLVGAGLLFSAGGLVLFGTDELFERPDETPDLKTTFAPRLRWPQLGSAAPIVFLILFMALVRQFDMAMLPLLVQEVHGSLAGVSRWTGGLFAAGSVAGLLAGIILGRLADRIPPPRIAQASALGGALAMIPQGLAQGFILLFMGRMGMMFCAGGLDPVFQIWLAKTTPPSRRGFIFGWATTAKSIGWIIAPLMSGSLAAAFGIRSIYFINSLFFLLLIPAIVWVVRKSKALAREEETPS